MVVKSSGVCGMVTTKKKITIPANNNVIESGGLRIEWVLTQIMLENANAIVSMPHNYHLALYFC